MKFSAWRLHSAWFLVCLVFAGGNTSGVACARISVPLFGIGPDPRNGPERPAACAIIPTIVEIAEPPLRPVLAS